MWKVTADLERFDEAVEWFRSRLPMTDEEYAQVDEDARKRAFTISGATQLDVVWTLYQQIDKAIEDGRGYDAFAKDVKERLDGDWGPEANWRLETTFRTNVQFAYGTGRWQQLEDPGVTLIRPYRMIDIVLDSRTSDICLQFEDPPVVLRHDDPYWLTHWNPFHQRCRTSIRSLTRAQAEAMGVSLVPPEPSIPVGFGMAPPKREEWSPPADRYPFELWERFRRKQEQRGEP